MIILAFLSIQVEFICDLAYYALKLNPANKSPMQNCSGSAEIASSFS